MKNGSNNNNGGGTGGYDGGKTVPSPGPGRRTSLLAAGAVVGRYTVVRPLGRGGTAWVFEARDPDGATVALKVMEESDTLPATLLERFRREAETAKKLREHPNIITVYDTGCDGGCHFIAMELVPDARDLETLVREHNGGLRVEEALKVCIPVAQAISFAHRQGVIHRDIKPANILISPFGVPLIADFGLVHVETEKGLTMTQTSMGTPMYMSPEQTYSSKVDHRTDVYSFGLVLFYMLNATLPYEIPADSVLGEVFDTIRRAKPVKPRSVNRSISKNLEAVLLKLLEKEPDWRYQEMSSVVADLEACSKREAVTVRAPNIFEKVERMIRRNKLAAFLVFAAAVLFGSTMLYFNRAMRAERTDTLLSTLEARRSQRKLEELKQQYASSSSGQEDKRTLDKRIRAGHEALRAGEVNRAQRVFTKLLQQGEQDGNPLLVRQSRQEIARVFLAENRYDEAARQFSALAADAKNTIIGAFAQFEAGVVYYIKGEKRRAQHIWRRAIAQNPRNEVVKFLCNCALRREQASRMARQARQKGRVVQAFAFYFAAEYTAKPEQKERWRRRACRAAHRVLPGYLSHFHCRRFGD